MIQSAQQLHNFCGCDLMCASKVAIRGIAIQPEQILTMSKKTPYYWVDDHPLLHGHNGRSVRVFQERGGRL